MIVSVDFDGTLCCDCYPAIGLPMPGAIEAMRTLHGQGHYIIVNTCREGQSLVEAINWMMGHGIPFARVNDNHPGNSSHYGWNSRKIFADVYIDDRNLGGFPGWEHTMKHLANGAGNEVPGEEA